jgi:hypothetical protein
MVLLKFHVETKNITECGSETQREQGGDNDEGNGGER